MPETIRRLRGVLGTAATWGATWSGIGLAGWSLGLFPDALAFAIPTAAVFGTAGAMAGAAFSMVLRMAEGHRTLTQLSVPRVGAWGAIGGLVIGVPLAIGMAPVAYFGTCAFLAVLGGGSAAGSVAIAKGADRRERPSLPASH